MLHWRWVLATRLEPGGEIWTAGKDEFRAVTGSRRNAPRLFNIRQFNIRQRRVAPPGPGSTGTLRTRRPIHTNRAIVAFWTHSPDKVVWERSRSGRMPLRMVGDWFRAEQVVNAESFVASYRAYPFGRRGVSRVCGLFKHLRDRAEHGRRR